MSSVSDVIDEDSLTKILRDHFTDKPDLKVTKVCGRERFTGVNDNLNSDIKKLKIFYKENGGDAEAVEKELDIVVKAAFDNRFYKFITKVAKPFMRETFWYKFAAPALGTKFPKVLELSPKCYYAYSNREGRMGGTFCENRCPCPCWFPVSRPDSGFMLLENASAADRSPQPFVAKDKTKIITTTQASTAMETLAHFHGAWWFWLNQENGVEPKTIHDLDRGQVTKMFSTTVPAFLFTGMLKATGKAVEQLLRSKKVDEDIIRRYGDYVKTKGARDAALILGHPLQEESKIRTVIHGDFWQNNLLFSEDNLKACMVDFQMLSIGHPARDIWYFFYICSDSTWRKEHLGQALESYFNTFRIYLDLGGLKMSFEEFNKEVQDRRSYGLFLGSEVVPNVLSPNALVLDNMNAFSAMKAKRKQEIAGEPKDDDHPMVTEIRRRLVDMVLEAAELEMI